MTAAMAMLPDRRRLTWRLQRHNSAAAVFAGPIETVSMAGEVQSMPGGQGAFAASVPGGCMTVLDDVRSELTDRGSDTGTAMVASRLTTQLLKAL